MPTSLYTGSRLLPAYLAAHALGLLGFWFVPAGGWLHASWQSVAGWISAAFMVAGIQRHRPAARFAWYAIAAGAFISSSGTLVETVAWRYFGVTTNPNVADLFWLALYPGLIVGLGVIVRRRAATEDLGTMMLNTAVCLLLNLLVGLLAWELIVWRAQSDPSVTLANRIIVTLYPLADTVVLALTVRLALGGGLTRPTLALLVTSLLAFLVSDVAWSVFLRSGRMPEPGTQYLMEATSITARALLACAALHPAIRDVAPPLGDRQLRLGRLGWIGLAASVVTAPLLLILQALLDRLYSVTSF